MEQIDLWRAFVEAQELIVNTLPPFYLKEGTIEEHRPGQWKAEVDLSRYRTEASEVIQSVFEGLPADQIDYSLGVIRKPEAVNFKADMFKRVFEKADDNQLHLYPDPAIIFYVKAEYTERDVWNRIIEGSNRIAPDRRKRIAYLTRSEILKITTGDFPIVIDPDFGAVFSNVHPSEAYTSGVRELMKRHLMNFQDAYLLEDDAVAHVYNEWIEAADLDSIIADTGMVCNHILLAVRVENNDYLYDGRLKDWRQQLGIYWFGEDHYNNDIARFKQPVGGYFRVHVDPAISYEDFCALVGQLRYEFNSVFGADDVKIQYRYDFSLDRNRWEEKLSSKIADADTAIQYNSQTASFDFRSDDDLRCKWEALSKIDDLLWPYQIDEHHFKVRYAYTNPLDFFRQELKQQFPGLNIYYAEDEDKLTCAIHYKLGDVHTKILATEKLENSVIPYFEKANFKIDFAKPPKGVDLYPFDFKQSEIEYDLERMLLKLRRNSFGLKDDRRLQVIGEIDRVKFPVIDYSGWPEGIPVEEIVAVPLHGNFKGDQDRLKRLKDTIEKIYSTSKSDCANPNIKAIVKDSSVAEGQEDVENSEAYLNLKDEVENSLLGKRVNAKQLEAVTKSLLAEDIFIIQGPPGTGKSTSISEIVWQHLKDAKDYRVLITSETNLAVDNALDKLRSPYHNLIKPARFGSIDKLDKEGRRFSVDHIKGWVKSSPAETDNDRLQEGRREPHGNIVEDWMNRVARQSGHYEYSERYSEAIGDWRRVLQADVELRQLFFDEYLARVNVVGATCSTIGERSSTESPTRFFHNYCEIYHPKLGPYKHSGIKFDLAIQDEASKASPPEMAIPMVYAKKNIIIGDHRQLPPMVDSNEFIDDITLAAKRSEDPEKIKRAKKIVRLIKENRSLFDESHFERLYDNITPALKTSLNTQYRMHSSINEVIEQFYVTDNGLACGLDYEASNSPDLTNSQSRFHGIDIPGFISPEHHIVWVDTKSPELKEKTSRYNVGEVNAVDKIIELIDNSGQFADFQANWQHEEDKQIGVISFYGAQLKQLEALKDKHADVPMRISTVDRFQGMERNIIIISTVRSDKLAAYEGQDVADCMDQPNLGFADSPNRLNVALSRAKRLLIVVGNADHFMAEHHGEKVATYANVINLIKAPENRHSLFIKVQDLEAL